MAILTWSQIQNTQEVTQITQAHVANMTSLVNAGHRAEVYLYYAKLLGSDTANASHPNNEAIIQIMIQAQITTYSGAIGGSALQGNFYAKTSDQANYDVSLDVFSKQILEGMISRIASDISPSNPEGPQSGILTDDQIQAADQGVWDSKGMKHLFPGNIQLTGQESNSDLSFLTNGYLALQASFNGRGAWIGKRYNEFTSDKYDLVNDDRYDLFINKTTGVIEGVFPTFTSYGNINNGAYLFNEIEDDQPNYFEKLIREEKWNYNGANGRGGPSIFDIADQYDNIYQESASVKDSINATLHDYFYTALNSYESYEDDILSLNAGERALFYNDITGYDLYTVDDDLVFPDPLEIELNHTENVIIDLPDGTGVNSNKSYTVTLNSDADQTFQLTYGNNIILDGNRSDDNGLDTVDYSQVGSATGLLFNLKDGSVKFQGSTSIKDYVGKQITNYLGSDYYDTFDIYKSYKSFQNPYGLTSFEGKLGIDTYNVHEDFKNVVIEDDGGVLLIDGKPLILDIDGGLLRAGSGEEQRNFEWQRLTNYTQPDGVTIIKEHMLLTEIDSIGSATSNIITIFGDWYADRLNWNFSYGDYNLVQGDNNVNYLIGEDGEHDNIIAKEGYWDFLVGLGGNDRLIGGRGQDFMDGGAGNDIYVYTEVADSFKTSISNNTHDSIVSFVQGEDKIDVTGLGFAGIKAIGTGASNELEFEHVTTSTGDLETVLTNTATNFYVDISGHITFATSDFIGLADEALNLAGDHNDNAYVDSAFGDDITTYGGDDVTKLSGGNDTVDGGEGTDKVVYAATSANYQLSSLALQNITITDGVGSDGADDISNVEVIEFVDQTLTWDGSAWIDPSAPTTTPGQWLIGTASLDNLIGGEGNDTIFGEGFIDFLDGRGGDDWINGGYGNDVIFYSNGNDTVDGGVGYDSFNYSPANNIGVSLLVDLAQGIAENGDIANGDVTTLANIDRSILSGTGDHHVIGNQNNNELVAYAGNDSLEGGDGDDWLDGGADNDFLDGGADNDVLIAGNGNDTLDGGFGDDSLYGYDGQDAFTLSGNFGDDVIIDNGGVLLIDGEVLLLSTTLTDTLETSSRLFAFEQEVGTENVILSEVDTLGITVTPSNVITVIDYFLNEDQWNFQITDNELNGTAESDLLIGDIGDDVLYGHDGDDSIIGGAGDDRSFGGDGNDTIIGDDGMDTLRGDEGSDVILGGGGDDRLLGQGGTDSIEGGEGNDWIWGNDDLGELQLDADDTLSGGNGNDTIIGDFGDDVIIGGTGKDLMRGEEGIDTFVYNSAADSGLNINNEHDVIQQFSQADGDQIDFSSMVEGTFTFLSGGNANFDFTGASNEIAYRNLGSSSKLFIDVDGDSIADMEINFVQAGGIDFTSSDFVF